MTINRAVTILFAMAIAGCCSQDRLVNLEIHDIIQNASKYRIRCVRSVSGKFEHVYFSSVESSNLIEYGTIESLQSKTRKLEVAAVVYKEMVAKLLKYTLSMKYNESKTGSKVTDYISVEIYFDNSSYTTIHVKDDGEPYEKLYGEIDALKSMVDAGNIDSIERPASQ